MLNILSWRREIRVNGKSSFVYLYIFILIQPNTMVTEKNNNIIIHNKTFYKIYIG